jgi:hypothetical protein
VNPGAKGGAHDSRGVNRRCEERLHARVGRAPLRGSLSSTRDTWK